jgi:muramoyltetrapeptide carboxypeptidase
MTKRAASLPRHPIAPGARIHVVAPAGSFDVDAFTRGVARLADRYLVGHDENITERAGLFAGNDERRRSELLHAIEDDEVEAIIAARGGHGSTRVLERLDPRVVAAHPKLLVGFSDITALHALWARAGLGSLHGPMVTKLADVPDAQFERWIAAVEGALPARLTGLSAITRGKASGRLVGGNLAVLTALLGSPWMPKLDGAVLFLEDVDERPYRVDRMLTSWRLAGVLRKVAAIALGGFTHCDPGPDGVTIEEVLADRLGDLGVPIVSGISAGHVEDNLELPLGAVAHVDATHGTLSFE